MSFRVDLLGPSDDEPERIGLVFTDEGTTSVATTDEGAAAIELTPDNALELAARISDVYSLHKRWLDARDRDSDAAMPEASKLTGLDVDSYRLHVLLESGYDLEVAEQLAKESTVDLHRAARLAKDAGPKLAGEILI
jgi:hypothetical protein